MDTPKNHSTKQVAEQQIESPTLTGWDHAQREKTLSILAYAKVNHNVNPKHLISLYSSIKKIPLNINADYKGNIDFDECVLNGEVLNDFNDWVISHIRNYPQIVTAEQLEEFRKRNKHINYGGCDGNPFELTDELLETMTIKIMVYLREEFKYSLVSEEMFLAYEECLLDRISETSTTKENYENWINEDTDGLFVNFMFGILWKNWDGQSVF